MYIKTFSHEAHNKVHPASLLIQSIQQSFTLSDFTNLLGETVNNITTVKCKKLGSLKFEVSHTYTVCTYMNSVPEKKRF